MHGSVLITFGARFHAPQAFQIVKLEAGAFSYEERSSKESSVFLPQKLSLYLQESLVADIYRITYEKNFYREQCKKKVLWGWKKKTVKNIQKKEKT